MTILRVYDPAECDEAGVPLDWECCRTCAGTGWVYSSGVNWPCRDWAAQRGLPTCGNHGSLKAAALAALEDVVEDGFAGQGESGQFDVRDCEGDKTATADQIEAWALGHEEFVQATEARFRVRCEDCGHPMSDGTWEGDKPYFGEDLTLSAALDLLRAGTDPADFGDGNCVHYSPCDKGCRHGGPGREWWEVAVGSDPWALTEDVSKTAVSYPREASWRPVEVRTLGWPMDLRPERLAVLCLRCYAERTT